MCVGRKREYLWEGDTWKVQNKKKRVDGQLPVNFKKGKASCGSNYKMSNIIIGHPPQKRRKRRKWGKENPTTLAFVMRFFFFQLLSFVHKHIPLGGGEGEGEGERGWAKS